MVYPITVSLIPGLPQLPYRNGVGAYEGVVAHSTATPNATAAAERSYEAGHWNDAFVHYFVDWTSIIQTADTKYLAWGAGPTANKRYVQVELCETADANLFKESYARYTFLLAKILFDRKLEVKHLETFFVHEDTSALFHETDHTDPIQYLASHGVTKAQLVNDVTAAYADFAKPYVAPAPAPAPKPVPAVPSVDGTWKKENGVWSFYVNGVKKTGWVKSKNNWYFLDAQGVMKQGWVQSNGKWYYMNPAPDKGEMMVGWIEDSGKKYYCDPTTDKGEMLTGHQVIDGKEYQFAPNGVLVQ